LDVSVGDWGVLACDKGRNGEPCNCDPLADDDPLRDSALVIRHDWTPIQRDVQCSRTHPRLYLPLIPPESIVSKLLSHLYEDGITSLKTPLSLACKVFQNANAPSCTCNLLVLLLFYGFCSISPLGFCSKAPSGLDCRQLILSS
jgi:hypothetical protein